GPAAAEAVPALLRVWSEPDDYTHQTNVEAARALEAIGAAAQDAVPAFAEAIRQATVRSNGIQAAIVALPHFGTAARAAIPALTVALDGPHRIEAAMVLAELDRRSDETRRALTAMWITVLEDPSGGCCAEWEGRRRAVKYLAEAEAGPEAREALTRALA